MFLTVVVTINVEPRFRGFLSSCMLEIAPGVYVSPKMSTGIRDRVWEVMCEWHGHYSNGYIVMSYPNKTSPAMTALKFLGTTQKTLVEIDGMYVVADLSK